VEFLKYVISLLVIMDPVFAAIMVASLVPSVREIKRVAFKASLTVLIASLVTLFSGDALLKLMGVNIFSIKIFGGLILLHMAFQMLQAKPPRTKHTEEESSAAAEKDDISVVPVGIPVLFGPGTFTTLLIFREEAKSIFHLGELLLAVLLSVFVTYVILAQASFFSRKLGTTGINVMVRIFGLFVGALGSQFIVDGVKHLWFQG